MSYLKRKKKKSKIVRYSLRAKVREQRVRRVWNLLPSVVPRHVHRIDEPGLRRLQGRDHHGRGMRGTMPERHAGVHEPSVHRGGPVPEDGEAAGGVQREELPVQAVQRQLRDGVPARVHGRGVER